MDRQESDTFRVQLRFRSVIPEVLFAPLAFGLLPLMDES